jgi:AraC-like DNA-binding protein
VFLYELPASPIPAIEQQTKRPTHMANEKDFSIVRFSTDDLPEKDRGAIWREHFGCKVFKAEIEPPPPDTALKVILAVRSMPELQLISGLYAAGRQHRTRRLIADDGNDDFILRIPTSGTMIVSAAGRELHSDYGAILTNAAEVSTLSRLTFGRTIVIRIPRSILSALVIDIDDIVMRPIPRKTSPLKLLVGYANALMTADTPVSAPELRHLVVSQITDLVAVMLGATRDAAYVAEGRGVSVARLHAAKAYLMENSGRQNLTAADVAAHLGVTIRHVQRLFESQGTTFSSFLLNQRLTRAYRMLCEPRFSFWEIGKIASYVGFSDLSHFGRCFRKLYGSSPREIRRADPNSKPRK